VEEITLHIDSFLLKYAEAYVLQLKEETMLRQKNWEDLSLKEIQEWAHQLKGNGGTYGLDYVSSLGRQMEEALKEGHRNEAYSGLLKLNQYINSVVLEEED